MRKLLVLGITLIGMIGCIGKVQVRDSSGVPLSDSALAFLADAKPRFAKDGLPNSELQVKAYESAIQDVHQAGHWFGGFFCGMPYAISTSFFNAEPKMAGFNSIPSDSMYWFSRYYCQEVNRIRSTNAWWGWGSRIVVGIGTYLIINSVTQ